jgi:hypothetical protein
VAQKKGNLHRPLTEYEKNNLDKFFSIYNTRTVQNDFTIRFQGKWYQLAQQQPCLVRKRERVQLEERTSGELFIALRNKYLNYTVLPARPERVKEVKVPALSSAKPIWKPPAGHPWRRAFILNSEKRYQTSSLVENSS